MRLQFRDIHIRRLLPAALLCLGLSSCVYDDGLEPDAPDRPADSYMVSFQLLLKNGSAQSHDASSRAGETWGDPNDPDRLEGDGTDNYIDFSTMRIGVYDAAGNLTAKVDHVFPTEIKGTADAISQSVRYDCIGEMEFTDEKNQKEFPDGNDYKVLIYLNTPGTEAVPATLNAANDLTFSYMGTESDVKDGGGIPMWGFITTDFDGMKAGERYMLDDMYLLRAMAKVRIEIGEDSKGRDWKITSVNVNKTNGNGYSLPKWNPASDKATTDLSLANNLHVLGSKIRNDEYDFTTSPMDAFLLYLPEKSNITDGDKCKIDVTVSNGSSERSGTIEFAKYENGQPTVNLFDIIRNHYYTFTIDCPENDNALRFKVTIADMENGGVFNYEYDFDL